MTPLERATKIVEEFFPRMECGEGRRKQIRDKIHEAIIECSNAELELRRAAERRLETLLRAIQSPEGPRVVVSKQGAYLEYKDPQAGEVFRWDGVQQKVQHCNVIPITEEEMRDYPGTDLK